MQITSTEQDVELVKRGQTPFRYRPRFDTLNPKDSPAAAATILSAGMKELKKSHNPRPGRSFNKGQWDEFVESREYRGYLHFQPEICCKAGNIQSIWAASYGVSAGFTPMKFRNWPNGTYTGHAWADAGPGGGKIISGGIGKPCVTYEVEARGMVGGFGQRMAKAVAGIGPPWIWQRISYTICCDKTQEITYQGSHFPSHYFYKDGNYVEERRQSDLAKFLFTGFAQDAAGGKEHVEH